VSGSKSNLPTALIYTLPQLKSARISWVSIVSIQRWSAWVSLPR
jgi:hypothetical protein